ncbi:MAG TPA: FkbM family methyltransferase [Vicinamibacterales bacterium]|nr:FkbM family methyltransferase [Vicinamibacterales bacterium]
MMQWQQIAKPWYVWRPWQLVRRASAAWHPPSPGYTSLPVAWGAFVIADPAKMIGKSIFTTGVYDLSVSEILARLIEPGDTVVDAGANVGYMTMLAGIAAGPTGQVVSWEPHPELFSVLQQNVTTLRRIQGTAEIDIRNAALGQTSGSAELVLPAHMESNDGLAYIGERSGSATSVTVALETIDGVIGTTPIAVMKLDVEGTELAVLTGARQALDAGRIRHIVFEDHVGAGSDVTQLLAACGYRIFSIGWSVRGLQLSERPGERLAAEYEAPNYVASLAPDDLLQRCSAPGWSTLSASFRTNRQPALNDDEYL